MPAKQQTLTDEVVRRRLEAKLPGWSLSDGSSRRAYATVGWSTTMMLVNAIAYISEASGHHPDLEVTWGKIRVALMTHDAGGLTERDLALAAEIERLALWQPPEPLAPQVAGRPRVRAVQD